MKTRVSYGIDFLWQFVGLVSLGGSEYSIAFPKEIPQIGGIYRLYAPKSSREYVGESKNLHRRLHIDYSSAGWVPGRKIRTNRRVQKWIYETLESNISPIEVFVCTEASIVHEGAESQSLDLASRYNRQIVEGLALASQPPDIVRINL